MSYSLRSSSSLNRLEAYGFGPALAYLTSSMQKKRKNESAGLAPASQKLPLNCPPTPL